MMEDGLCSLQRAIGNMILANERAMGFLDDLSISAGATSGARIMTRARYQRIFPLD